MRTNTSLWELYDTLIDTVPASARVEECVCGLNWFAVRAGGVGLSMSPGEGAPTLSLAGRYAGMALKDLAALSKSWNFHEAALGVAAINAAVNEGATVAGTFGQPLDAIESANCFHHLREDFRGRKVAVVGHFRDLEPLKDICDLTILERKPQTGDLPDPACEYVLPGQDIVVITAVTLINKTLPRLLQLAKGARIVLTGPTVPLTPILYGFGVEMLAGLVVTDPVGILRTVQEGGQHQLFETGSRMVTFKRPPAAARMTG
jgi:uncharacterized protein (DUF4213/DUF364 family)